ncbi:MAG: rarD [Alphaproteobacteria bacterium]|nr:rarD [Alphaproteobacteria bacterium]
MDEHARARTGLFFGLGAYLSWGVLPLYFKALSHVFATEIVAQRLLWSLIFLAALLTLWKRWASLKAILLNPKLMLALSVTAVLIAINWLVYIWAVVNGHALAGSLGYYLNPLVNVLLGVVLLRERLTKPQIVAITLGAIGVLVLATSAGAIQHLWISLSVAISFGVYGYIRKIIPVEAIEGLAVETLLLSPFALAYVLWLQQQGQSGFGRETSTDVLLILGGVITATPMLFFGAAARRLRLTTIGLLQYISPSLQFLIAVFVFGEKLTLPHLICFGFIWAALAIFAVDSARSGRAAARDRAAARV